MKRLAWTIVAVGVALGLGACGSSDGPTGVRSEGSDPAVTTTTSPAWTESPSSLEPGTGSVDKAGDSKDEVPGAKVDAHQPATP